MLPEFNLRVQIARQFGLWPWDERITEALSNDYKRAMLIASFEIKTPEQSIIEFLYKEFPEIIKVYSDRIGTAALVGGTNANRGTKAIMNMDGLYKDPEDETNKRISGQVLVFPGSTTKVIM